MAVMEDTGEWERSGKRWHIIQRQDGSVVCNCENGDFTAASAETWAIWKSWHV